MHNASVYIDADLRKLVLGQASAPLQDDGYGLVYHAMRLC